MRKFTALFVFMIFSAAAALGTTYLLQSPVSHAPLTEANTAGACGTAKKKSDDILPKVEVKPSEKMVDDFPESMEIIAGDKTYTVTYTGNQERGKKIVLVPLTTNYAANYSIDPKKGDPEKMLEGLLVDGEPRALVLRFARSLPGYFIVSDVNREINESFTDVDIKTLRPNIDRFLNKFANGSSSGDFVYFVWLPGGKLYVGYETPNDVEFIAKDVPFVRALWRLYAGKHRDDRTDLVKRFAEKPGRGSTTH